MRLCLAPAVFVVLAAPAFATSPCVVLDPDEVLQDARYAFVGKVLSRTPADLDGRTVEPRDAVRGLYGIRVIEEFKGEKRPDYEVIGDWPVQAPEGYVLSSTPWPLEVGKEYLIVAWGEPPRIDPCASDERRNVAQETLVAFRRLPNTRASGPSIDPSLVAAIAPKGLQTVDERVRFLLDQAVQTQEQERAQAAFDALVGMGCAALPALGQALSDDRRLLIRYLRLHNDSKDAFEGFRQYGPETVTDVVAAILNQLTGRHFGFIYNGASPAERKKTVAAWREFLAKTPPEKLCSKAPGVS